MKTQLIQFIRIGIIYLLIIMFVYSSAQAQFPIKKQKQSKYPKLAREVLLDIVMSLPNPIETIEYTHWLMAPYKKANLSAKADNYLYQAWLIGMHFTRLHQALAYKKYKVVAFYINTMQPLIATLNSSKYFPANDLKALLKNDQKLDELLNKINQSYENLSDYWLKNGNPETSILMATGSFVESLYLLASISKETHAKEFLWNYLGYQKITLEQHLLLLSFYEEFPIIKKIIFVLNDLQRQFDEVKTYVQFEKPSLTYTNDVIIVEDNTRTRIKILKPVQTKLITKIKEVRTQLMPKNE